MVGRYGNALAVDVVCERFGWLAHLCGFGKGGNSCCPRRDFRVGITPLIDSHRALFPENTAPKLLHGKALTADLAVPTFTKT